MLSAAGTYLDKLRFNTQQKGSIVLDLLLVGWRIFVFDAENLSLQT